MEQRRKTSLRAVEGATSQGRQRSSCLRIICLSLLLTSLVFITGRSFAAEDRATLSLWRPADIKPTSDTLATVLAALRKNDTYAGIPHGERKLEFTVDASGILSHATAMLKKNDYALTIDVQGVTFKEGRLAGHSWFDNTTGSTLRGRGPLALDRFPLTELGFDAADCTLIGSSDSPAPAWVLELRPIDNDSRWLFVDKKSGEISREIYRSNVDVETFTFDHVLGSPGNHRPYRYNVQGEGGPEAVYITSNKEQPVSDSDVAIPPQPGPIMPPPASKQKLDVHFGEFRQIHVPVEISGRKTEFVLDSGTSAIVISTAIAKTNGGSHLHVGLAHNLTVGGMTAPNVVFDEDSIHGYNGLLGFDFFRNRIVHVDYARQEVDVLPRASFQPPPGAVALPTDWSFGVPIVSARIGNRTGSKFLLDLGSSRLLLFRQFSELTGQGSLRLQPGLGVDDNRLTYGSGGLSIEHNRADVTLGAMTLAGMPVDVELPNRENMTTNVDGIVGTEELDRFEWWFDADGTSTYFRSE